VICDYADHLAGTGGRLCLSGLDPDLIEWLRGTGRVGDLVRVAGGTPVLGEST